MPNRAGQSNTRYKGRKLLQNNGNRSRFLQSLASENIVSPDMRERMDQDFDDFISQSGSTRVLDGSRFYENARILPKIQIRPKIAF